MKIFLAAWALAATLLMVERSAEVGYLRGHFVRYPGACYRYAGDSWNPHGRPQFLP